ncbi:MAG: transglutaminase-like domain-containing protein [Armatimonadetes bacterium]|nr:transglutaminase-like domain-containing protein [Armatimonadota bacterium]
MKKSPIWIMYTGKSGDYVDPENSTIKAEGDRIWSESAGILEYARRCYEYVAANYRYLNPGTGVHPLSKLFEQGGGDCGNLSSIFISLLRHKGIPARHLVAYRTGGGGHVFADFFLEDYGWIPVDVTSKNSNRSGDYFGKVEGDSDCIILNRKLDLRLQVKDGELGTFGLLQGFFWWYWGSGTGDMSADYTVSAVPLVAGKSSVNSER